MKLTPDERIIIDLMKKYAFGVVQPPKHKLKYHSVEPGLAYSNTLWDWDSYWAVYALNDFLEVVKDEDDFDYDYYRKELDAAAKGDVLNFLDYQEEDGFVPIMLRADYYNDDYATRPNVLNAHKPFLCKAALLASKMNNDYTWVDVAALRRLIDYYRTNQYHQRSGLFFWRDDVMIGADNSPVIFGRPKDSSADVYINAFMVTEYDALISIMKERGMDAAREEAERDALVKAIDKEMWDEREGLYFAQDLLVTTNETEIFHKGLPAFWSCLPIKIEHWCCYLPLACGFIADDRADRVIEHYNNSKIKCNHGIRTVSADEKMYDLTPSGNPSNWLGAVWTIANYLTYEGLTNYGRTAEAEEMYEKTIRLLADGIKRDGSMCESYHPDTGEGILHRMFFSWNMLAASMILKKYMG